MTGTDTFAGTALAPMWEWNHNSDATNSTANNLLTLHTATVTDDLYAARNTLTRRIHGRIGTGTVVIDFTNMADGDRAGLAAFRQVVVNVVPGVFSYSLDGNIFTGLGPSITLNTNWEYFMGIVSMPQRFLENR
ncbi:hypothetical protein C8R45DRAFT_470062 [Mycena sanguinolenta]|nr:hypothetical protein C8R45DRAFT_470062 [Mycena sanguinolenta]